MGVPILFTNRLSTFSAKVEFALNESGLKYEKVPVDLGKREHYRKDFVEKFLTKKVPALSWDSFFLTESSAIVRYVAARLERYDWYPLNLEDRAHIDQWLDFANMHVCKPLGDLCWYRCWAAKFNQRPSPELEASAERSLKTHLEPVERQLEKHAFLASSQLTIADFGLAVFLDLSEISSFDLKRYAPETHRYLQRMRERSTFPSILKNQASSG